MKSNMLLQVQIGNHRIPVEHKTMFGSLTEIWRIGNSYRQAKGLKELDLGNYLRSPELLEYVKVIEKRLNLECVETTHSEGFDFKQKTGMVPTIKSPLIVTKRGNGGGTWTQIHILIDAAAKLDADFKYDLVETFITNKILQWRDDSGDEFINLNVAIDAYLPDRKKYDKEVYIETAILLKDKIRPDNNSWNYASYTQLEQRTKIERSLIDFLKLGLVKDFNHLKELIQRI